MQSIRYGEWGISPKGIPGTKRRIRDGALAFVRGKLFPSPLSPCLKIKMFSLQGDLIGRRTGNEGKPSNS